jgi:hypothetical protein
MTQTFNLWSRLLKLWAVALMVAVPLAFTACGGDDDDPASGGSGGMGGTGGTATGGTGGATGGTGGATGGTGGTGGTATGGTAGTGVETVATPAFSIPGGTYDGPQTVQITVATSGATIHYTLDGNNPTTGSAVYTGPISLAAGTTTTIRAFAVLTGNTDSAVNSATYIIKDGGQAAAPTFAPPGGTYSTAQDVTITSTTAGATIHYTLDGNDPNAGSPVYSAPIPLSSTTTVKAIALATGFTASPVSTATYTFPTKAATPVFSLAAGTYTGPQTVAITSSTPGAQVHYTTDGSDPDATSTPYTAPLSIAATTTVRAIAIATGYLNSDISQAIYTIQGVVPPAATPTFSPGGGTYATPQTVTIASTTLGAEIRYTMDGTDPTMSSTVYTAPVSVANSLTLKAMATATNYTQSQIATAIYTFTTPQAVAPTITPNGGTFTAPVEVTLATAELNGVIIYTTDGTLPATGNGSVYSGPFTVSATSVINAVTTAAGKLNSNPATAMFTINIPVLEVQPVTIAPGTTTSNNDIDVTLTTATSGATICYTTDGSQPTCTAAGACQTGQMYGGVPVTVNRTGTVLTARGCMSGMTPSATSNATYTLNAAAVQFQPAPGVIAFGSLVTMTSATDGATIRYRTDGVAPTCTTGQIFSVGVPVSQNTEFRAIACKANYTTPAVTTGNYSVALLQLSATVPTATVANPVTTSRFHVVYPTGFTAPGDMVQCYTLDGAAPTCAANGTCGTGTTAITGKTADPFLGVLFTALPSLDALATPSNSTRTIRTTACAANYTAAPVTTVVYTYQVATPVYGRESGTATLASGAPNSISTTTNATNTTLRYYDVAAGGPIPTLSCTGAAPAGVTTVTGNTTTAPHPVANGGDTFGAIGCKTNYLPSTIATATYPLPNQTAAPTFSTQGTTVFNNDVAANSVTMDSTSITDDGLATANGVICWTTADTGNIDCTESATSPTCVFPVLPQNGVYTITNTTTGATNVPPTPLQTKGKQLRAIACGNGLAKSTVTSQVYDFRVGNVVITPPPSATSNTIGIGETLQFSTVTLGASFRYTVGTVASPPADPNCTSVGTIGSSYTITNGDRLNGSVIVKVIGCRNGYDPSPVATSNTYTNFRGAAATFSIPAGNYGDTLDTGSTNLISGRVRVNVPTGLAPTRVCVTVNGTTPTCGTGATPMCTGTATNYISNNADNLTGYQPGEFIDWADIDDSNGFTLRAIACYADSANVANPPVTVEGPYNFAIAALTVTNTTTTPNPTPFAKTQRLRYLVGEDTTVPAPGNTSIDGWANLCYTFDGSPLGAGCATAGAMSCIPVSVASGVARLRNLYLDSSWTINAKVCKSIMTPQTNTQAITIAPWSKTLTWNGSDEFLGTQAEQFFFCTNSYFGPSCNYSMFRMTWNDTFLYVSGQGCGIRSETAAVGNYWHAYLGSPSLIGTNYQQPGFIDGASTTMSVFPATTGPNASVLGGARWHLLYNVETHAVQLRQYNFSNGNWNDVVANTNIDVLYGNGASTWNDCAAWGYQGNYGDWVTIRIPWATLGNVRHFNVSSAFYLATPPAFTTLRNQSAWPASNSAVPFQTTNPMWFFDRMSWRAPRGTANGDSANPLCWRNGLDNSPTCQIPESWTLFDGGPADSIYDTDPRRSSWTNVAPTAPYNYFVGPAL